MTETAEDETPGGRVSLAPLNPEDALRALLKVDPESEPAERDNDPAGRTDREASDDK